MEGTDPARGGITPGGTMGAREDGGGFRTLWPYGDRPLPVASALSPGAAVASRVSVLLLARMEDTSTVNVDAASV